MRQDTINSVRAKGGKEVRSLRTTQGRRKRGCVAATTWDFSIEYCHGAASRMFRRRLLALGGRSRVSGSLEDALDCALAT
jgi:hypothetical protein